MFIERARAAAPGAAEQLANAIAVRYGIPAAEVTRRLAVGRFRVKGNVDRATADTFAADLVRLGAVVTVSAVDAPVPAIPEPVSLQQPRVAKPAPPAPAPKPEAPRARPPSQSPYTSGLAAAMAATDLEEPGLGALSGEFPLQLSTLDGADDASVSSGGRSAVPLPASFGPPSSAPSPVTASVGDDIDVSMDDDDDQLGIASSSGPMPASIGPAAGVMALGERPRTSNAPAALSGAPDMFAPPEAAAELQLVLEVEDHRRPPAGNPPVTRTVASAPAPAPVSTTVAAEPAPAAPPRPPRLEPAWKTHGRDPRVRYVAGLVLATALGFIPATIIASIRERSAFAELNAKYEERESQVISRVQWDDLDRVRASFLERKRAERQSIAFTSLLIWAALSGGLAYVWFRVIDWDRVFGPPPR